MDAADTKKKYDAQAERMVKRWSGVQGRTREAAPNDAVVRSRESAATRRLQNIKGHVVTEPAREIEVLEEVRAPARAARRRHRLLAPRLLTSTLAGPLILPAALPCPRARGSATCSS